MWTKSEDLQNKYVKLSSQQDYETAIKVLHEFGFKMYDGMLNDKYYEKYPYISIHNTGTYANIDSAGIEIPIQQFYDYLSSKTLKVEDLVEGEIYKYLYVNGKYYLIAKCSESKTLRVSNYIQIYDNNENNNLGRYNNCSASKSVQLASTEEKKHLEVCIKQDKFIPKEDLHLYDDVTFELKSLQNKPKYETGKWYKINHIWHAKFKCFHGSGMYWKYSKQINWKGDYRNDSGNIEKYQSVPISELTDLLEIQQYLPDGHSDKIKPMDINEFKKGDYIVTLNVTISHTDCGKNNYCFKQRENNVFISPEVDLNGYKANSNNTLTFDKSNNLQNWRYATPEEIAEYDRLGKPYDVTTLNKPKEKSLVGRYLKALVNYPNGTIYKEGDYIQIKTDNLKGSVTCEKKYLFGWDFYDWQKSNVELMPEGFIPPNKTFEWIPQVGDWVIAVTPELSSYCKALKNKAYKIKSIRASNEILELEGSNEIRKEHCRKAELHEIPNNTTQEVKEMFKTIDLSNTKIRVNSPELSKLVQEKAFELGWSWLGGKKVNYTEEPYLYFWNYKSIGYGNSEKYFYSDFKREIFPSDLGIGNIIKYESDNSKLELPKDYVIGIDPYKEYPLISQECFKIDNNQINLLVKQSDSVTLKRTENEVNIKVNNLKTIKI